VSDSYNNRVLKFPPNSDSSTMSSIIAGSGTYGAALNQLNTPWGIYVDESDSDTLYVVDNGNNRVMKWLANATSGTVVAGGNGEGALYTQLNYPWSVIVDSSGTVYVSEFNNYRIVKWLKNANTGTLVAGISGSTGLLPTQLQGPSGIRFDTNGNLYVCDQYNNRVQRFTIDNTSC
jgi:sugar lactone lactonase YvrE